MFETRLLRREVSVWDTVKLDRVIREVVEVVRDGCWIGGGGGGEGYAGASEYW